MTDRKRLVHEDGTLCFGGKDCSRRTHYFPEELTPSLVQATLHGHVMGFHARLKELKAGLHSASLLCEGPGQHLLKIAAVLVAGAETMLQVHLESPERTQEASGLLLTTILAAGHVARKIE